MLWARMLAYITGTVDQELLLRNEYLAAENRISRAQVQGRLLLSDAEKATLAEIAYRLGRKALDWRRPRNRIRCWPGTEGSSPTSSTAQSVVKPEVVPQGRRKASGWWCRWRGKIPAGAMTGSWAPWPIWVTSCRIRRWAIYSDVMIFHQLPSGSRPGVGKTSSVRTWQYWWPATSSRWKCLRGEV
jgi:hypothetical protein